LNEAPNNDFDHAGSKIVPKGTYKPINGSTFDDKIIKGGVEEPRQPTNIKDEDAIDWLEKVLYAEQMFDTFPQSTYI
jgi:hypothetical protein